MDIVEAKTSLSAEANQHPKLLNFVATPNVSGRLGERIIHGTSWMALGGIVNKLASLFTQVLLAMYLLPSEYGIASVAISCRSIAFLFSSGGFHDLLISRPRTFARDGPTILYLVVALHLAAALLLLVLAFPIETAMGTSGLGYAILIVALMLPIQAIPSVYIAKLKIDERFSVVAVCGIVVNVVFCGSAIALAVGGAGEYALLVPLLASAAASAIIHRTASGGLGWKRIQFHRWPSLVRDAKWLLLTAFVTALEISAIPFFLAIRGFNSADIGIFAFGVVLTLQATQLFGVNLRAVLVPTLANRYSLDTKESHHQRVRLLLAYSTWLIVPICALQVILAKPVSEYILPIRWQGIEGVIVVLSMAMAFEPMKLISSVYLVSSQKFGTNCALRLVSAGAVILAALICSADTSVFGLAVWVSAGWIVGSLFCAFLGTPFEGGRITKLAELICPPMICGLILITVTRPLAVVWADGIWEAFIWASTFMLAYCIALRLLAPALFSVIAEQWIRIANRLRLGKSSIDSNPIT